MKRYSIILIAILVSKIALAQDTIIDFNSYKVIPKSDFYREKALFRIIDQKAFDYWEYRYVADQIKFSNSSSDSIDKITEFEDKYDVISHGLYKDIKDSIELSKISCREGFWWVPPAGGVLYIVSIKSHQIDSVINKNDLYKFLKPFNSLDKIRLYFDNYGLLKYRNNLNNFELIVFDWEKPIRYYKNKNGHFNVFNKLYLRINSDGGLYIKRIGEYHLKTTEPFIAS